MKETSFEFIRNSILAGILIGLGGFANLMVGEPFVGAFVFSIGLISVIILGCNLYTGKVGYARTPSDFYRLVPMCILNIAGAILFGLATHPVVQVIVEPMMENKLQKSPLNIFIMSAVCGALIYLAIELFRNTHNVLTIIIPVFTFVAIGADHCIANAYYFAAARMISVEVVEYLIICILGNAIGSLLVSLLQVKNKR